MSLKIKEVRGREILDSRGNPTVEVRVELENGVAARASVPSGASTGIHEAWELRDKAGARYGGKGVLMACKHVNKVIGPKLKGMPVTSQKKIDSLMIDLDGTQNKKRLGANAILGVSMALTHTAARTKKIPLYEYLNKTYRFGIKKYKLPTPLMNVLNGGEHADNDLAMQEFIIIPVMRRSFAEKVRVGSEIFHALGKILRSKKMNTGVGNEGGYAPNVGKTENAIKMIVDAIKKAGYEPGKEVGFGLDVAASEFYSAKRKLYTMKIDGIKYNYDQMNKLYAKWIKKYPLMSIEDGLDQDDWEGWKAHTKELGKKSLLIGDDLFVTNTKRLQRGIDEKVANAILIKMNQIGTISETMAAIKLAQKNKYKVVISHRSGETCDTTIADLAVGAGAEYIKTGSLSRSERISKYNRLMDIELMLKGKKTSDMMYTC